MAGLVLRDVSLAYERGRKGRRVQVLSKVSLDVQPGEIVGVVGGRESGKTTLLAIAAALMRPEAGRVCLGDVELTGLRGAKRASVRAGKLVWVARSGMSQKLEVAKIVGWPLVRHRERRDVGHRAAEMLDRVGAAECAKQRWDELSPWQQVLVGLAQGFAGEPEIVVIDDLLDGLGLSRTEQASDLVRSLIQETEHGCGVLMSASGRDSVVLVDRSWSLEEGELTAMTGHNKQSAEILPFRPLAERRGSRRLGRR